MNAEKTGFRLGRKPYTVQRPNLIGLFFVSLSVHRVSAVQWAVLELLSHGGQVNSFWKGALVSNRLWDGEIWLFLVSLSVPRVSAVQLAVLESQSPSGLTPKQFSCSFAVPQQVD
ncbi:MAG: hypothetical protein AAB676_05215 [Verrucomicrobiota bacterium]